MVGTSTCLELYLGPSTEGPGIRRDVTIPPLRGHTAAHPGTSVNSTSRPAARAPGQQQPHGSERVRRPRLSAADRVTDRVSRRYTSSASGPTEEPPTQTAVEGTAGEAVAPGSTCPFPTLRCSIRPVGPSCRLVAGSWAQSLKLEIDAPAASWDPREGKRGSGTEPPGRRSGPQGLPHCTQWADE